MLETPALDRLTDEVYAALLAHFAQGLDKGPEPLRARTAELGSFLDYISPLEPASAQQLTVELHRLSRASSTDDGRKQAERQLAATMGTPAAEVTFRAEVVYGLQDRIWSIVSRLAADYAKEELGLLFAELYAVHEEQFDPELGANQLDYNAHDGLPDEDMDTPYHYLQWLLDEAIAARLIKRHGAALLVRWLTCLVRAQA